MTWDQEDERQSRKGPIIEEGAATEMSGLRWRKCWICGVKCYGTKGKANVDSTDEGQWITVNLGSGITVSIMNTSISFTHSSSLMPSSTRSARNKHSLSHPSSLLFPPNHQTSENLRSRASSTPHLSLPAQPCLRVPRSSRKLTIPFFSRIPSSRLTLNSASYATGQSGFSTNRIRAWKRI